MKKAFTLIELLIVIAILAILGLGILIALDPVEQTRRASDSTVQQSAIEIKDAVNRFYAADLYYPWCQSTSPAGSCTYLAGCVDGTYYNLSAAGCGQNMLNLLTSTGELKSNPPANITAALNFIPSSAGMAFAVGFNPSSKSFDGNLTYLYQTAAPRCTTAGTLATCPVPNNTCDYCIK